MGFDGDAAMLAARRNDQLLVLTAFFLGQQGDKGLFKATGLGSLKDLLRRAGGQYLAGVHCYQPVKVLGFIHVGAGNQHAHLRSTGANAPNQIPELAA